MVALGLGVWEIYGLWKRGPWDLPSVVQAKPQVAVEKPAVEANMPRLVNTEIIISKNLFDPERGAGLTRESELNSRAFQRIRGMILLGTAIIGNIKQALLQDGGPTPAGPGNIGQSGGPMRVKLGDAVEGFTLSEIGDKRVTFTKGTSRVELVLDYFRKVEPPRPGPAAPAAPGQLRQPAPPAPVAPRVVPALPRRQPAPGSTGSDSNS